MAVQHGTGPAWLECSSKGDKRFSAFGARIKARGGKCIEEIYQAAKVFDGGEANLSWREAKGRKALNQAEVNALYSKLWDEYIAENRGLMQVLLDATGLRDCFGQAGHVCQATELWRIRCARLKQLGKLPEPEPTDLEPRKADISRCVSCQHYHFGSDHVPNASRCKADGSFRGVLIRQGKFAGKCAAFLLQQDAA